MEVQKWEGVEVQRTELFIANRVALPLRCSAPFSKTRTIVKA